MFDWCFTDDRSICHFRAAGILKKDNQVLLQCDDHGAYAFPGGHVMFGETAEQALIREFKEETDAAIVCDRLVWVEENFWRWDGKDAHGIVFYFVISLCNPADIPNCSPGALNDHPEIALQWVPIEEIKGLTLYPKFAKEKLEPLSEGIEHLVSYE